MANEGERVEVELTNAGGKLELDLNPLPSL